jgi:hypothetical protein
MSHRLKDKIEEHAMRSALSTTGLSGQALAVEFEAEADTYLTPEQEIAAKGPSPSVSSLSLSS